LPFLDGYLMIKVLNLSNEGIVRAIAERAAAAKRHRATKTFFANSPLAFLDLGDSSHTIELIRKGLPASAIDHIAGRLSLSRAALLEAIKIPLSTVERRLRTGEALSAEEGDRVSRVAKTVRRAAEVFGDTEQGAAWMTDSISSLGGKTPLSLLDTVEGYELVQITLSRIEYGVYA
jgi:putative toxin-antitoxin system antitoxin component (TIGR02293 family)